jgi:hypothetical protein
MDHDEQTVKKLAIKLCADAGYDPYIPTCDIYSADDPDCIYPWAGFRHLAKKQLDITPDQTVVAKVKELTQPYSPVDDSDIRKLFLMLAEEIDELKKIHTESLANTDKETDWTDAIADEFFHKEVVSKVLSGNAFAQMLVNKEKTTR